MKKFKILSLLATAGAVTWSLITGHDVFTNLVFAVGACAELTAFRTAVESLDQDILRSRKLGRKMFWYNAIPRGTFVKNQGVTRSTFQIKASEPADDQSLWYNVTLSDGQPNNACDVNYEDIGVSFFERTYGPKKRRFRGPVICRENLTFQHTPEQFLNSYVDEMGRVIARVWEFTLRRDYVNFGNVYVDGTKYSGPNALASAPRAYEGISQDRLDDMASEMIDLGAGGEAGGYTTFGDEGPIFPLEIDKNSSRQVLNANSTIRDNSRYASMGKGADSDLSFFKAVGASRIIGNFRHMTTNVPLRLNYTGGAWVVVSPFKDITAVGSDGVILTDAFKNAAFEAAIAIVPNAFRADVVTPTNWNFPDTTNYNGEWDFIVGGERICTPSAYDPQHEKGRHFAKIEYAPAPIEPYLASTYIFKRCSTTKNLIFCS